MSEAHSLSTLRTIYTVSQLNNEARRLLENRFKSFWMSGEVSGLSQPSSGHWYFFLKDDRAQVKCVCFHSYHRRLSLEIKNGLQILVQAYMSLYEPRGDFQLNVVNIIIQGSGSLQLDFLELKKRLHQSGLFAAEHKKPIPIAPETVGVITSSSGAALFDILRILKKRLASIAVILYPTLVQGKKAAAQIIEAIRVANRRKECDVLILARGGGSIEDLWCFNEESVAQAIFASAIPIVTGIGHETDFTIADFVADQRAATPSAAAMLVSPDQSEWWERMNGIYRRLKYVSAEIIRRKSLAVHHLSRAFAHPLQKINLKSQKLDQLEHRLHLHMRTILKQHGNQLNQAITLWQALSLQTRWSYEKSALQSYRKRLCQAMENRLQSYRRHMLSHAQILQNLNPLTTLNRGYAILIEPKTHHVIRSIHQVTRKERIKARLSDGYLTCCIEETEKN